jgi:hypothetical protein
MSNPLVALIDHFQMFSRPISRRAWGFVALASRRLLRPRFRHVRSSAADCQSPIHVRYLVRV